MHIFEETLPRAVWWSGGVVKIDVFVAVVRAQTDHIPLVSDKIDKCVLPIESADRRITLANGLSDLVEKAERRRVCKLEADEGMCDPWGTPVINGQVDTSDLREPDGARLPARRVIGVSSVVAVADVVKSNFIAVDVRPCQLRHVGLPVTIVTWFQCQPPREYQGEC